MKKKAQNLIAFIDENGNSELDFRKKGSHYFVVSAVVVQEENIANIEKELQDIKDKYFNKKHINSRLVAADKYLEVLEVFAKLDFEVFAIVIDKQKLEGKGFKDPNYFYRFLQYWVDRVLFSKYPHLKLSDNRGFQKPFMESFVPFVKGRHIPDLFSSADFRFVPNGSLSLTQLSQFVCATLVKTFDKNQKESERNQYLSLLKDKISSIRKFPMDYKPFYLDPNSTSSQFNQKITKMSLELANNYILRKEGSSIPYEIDQVNTLKHLVFHFKYLGSERYILTSEIIKHVNSGRQKPITVHYFRSKVIAKLRDEGILISSSALGYKLPANEADLYNFINHNTAIIHPMLSRIKKCRDQIRKATGQELDILAPEEYHFVRKFFDVLEAL
jgi:hypothetical protein